MTANLRGLTESSSSTSSSLLTFNLLLRSVGISPEGVRLLRHQDTRMRRGWTTYNLWRRDPQEFNRYEASQAPDKFKEATHIASFVADPDNNTIFIGISKILGGGYNTDVESFDYVDGPQHEIGTVYRYQLERDRRFDALAGKLVIDWGLGLRSWVQRADNQDKCIIEVRRDVRDVEWPGFMQLKIDERDVVSLAPNWVAKLSSANGVYLLVCPETGEQYVGAAFGRDGFLSRWTQYALNGHGGNKLLKERRLRTRAPLQISILEVFGSTTTEAEAFQAESRWKRTLGTRAHGLNAN